MPNTVRLKRSAVAGRAPATSDLALGELAINTYDGKLYLKKNNGADAIVEVGAGGSSSSSATVTIDGKTSAYTVVAGDLGKIINCTANTFTVTLTAAATLGSGFNCWIWNTGTGAITIDPNASETIDGSTTIILRQGEGVQVICDGTNWATGAKKAMRRFAENVAASARAVASGSNSFAIGGTASGTDSVALSGTASAQGAFALFGTANGQYSVAIAGNTNAIGAVSAYVDYYIGSSDCSGMGSFVTGNACVTGGRFTTAMGCGASAVVWGKFAHSGNRFSGSGDSQWSNLVLRATTTDATATVLESSPNGGRSNSQVNVPNNGAFAFTGTVVARQKGSDGTASAAWKVEGLIRREGSAGTTTLVASTVTAISNVPGWTLALSADTTNGALAITGTGAAATNVRWVATIQCSELYYS